MRSKTSTFGVKKLFLIIFLFSVNIFNAYGAEFKYTTDGVNTGVGPTVENAKNLSSGDTTGNTGPGDTTVVVTEDIPWAKCVPYKDKNGETLNKITNKKFTCTVEPGFGSVMQMFAGLVKYATFLAALVGVLMIAVAGVRLSISGIESGEKTKAKEMITKIIYSLIILFLISFILNSVAPWIYQ